MSTFNYNSGSSHIPYTGSLDEIELETLIGMLWLNHSSSKEWIQNIVQSKLDKTYRLMLLKMSHYFTKYLIMSNICSVG